MQEFKNGLRKIWEFSRFLVGAPVFLVGVGLWAGAVFLIAASGLLINGIRGKKEALEVIRS